MTAVGPPDWPMTAFPETKIGHASPPLWRPGGSGAPAGAVGAAQGPCPPGLRRGVPRAQGGGREKAHARWAGGLRRGYKHARREQTAPCGNGPEVGVGRTPPSTQLRRGLSGPGSLSARGFVRRGGDGPAVHDAATDPQGRGGSAEVRGGTARGQGPFVAGARRRGNGTEPAADTGRRHAAREN